MLRLFSIFLELVRASSVSSRRDALHMQDLIKNQHTAFGINELESSERARLVSRCYSNEAIYGSRTI